MSYAQIQVFEPIEVISHFHNSQVNILKFKWNNQVYKVTKIANIWRLPDNEEGFKTHFTVVCDDAGILCELSYYHKCLKWELIQYDSLD